MKQKVTVQVAMKCESCRNKALKTASMIKGVSAVAIEGDSKDLVVVTGEDVDTVCLGRSLRKKFCILRVLTVEEVKPKKEPPKKEEPPKEPPKKEEPKEPKVVTLCVVPPCCKCQSHKCEGKCEPCGSCQSHKCKGTCEPCGKCGSHKCESGCRLACYRCGSYSCHGQCAAVICYGQCPPWLSCRSCCSKPPYAGCYNVVYDPDPPTYCSIQ